jgi:hypothetical protein
MRAPFAKYLLILLGAGCTSANDAFQPPPVVQSPEQRLAAIDVNLPEVPPSHYRVFDFRLVLDRLCKKCPTSSRESIADTCRDTYRGLRNRGAKATLLQTAQELDATIVDNGVPISMTFSELAALFANQRYAQLEREKEADKARFEKTLKDLDHLAHTFGPLKLRANEMETANSTLKTKVLRQSRHDTEVAVAFKWLAPSRPTVGNFAIHGFDEFGIEIFSSGYAAKAAKGDRNDEMVTGRFLVGNAYFREIKRYTVTRDKNGFGEDFMHATLKEVQVKNPQPDGKIAVFDIEAKVFFDRDAQVNWVALQALDKEGFELGFFQLFADTGPFRNRTVTARASRAQIWADVYPHIHRFQLAQKHDFRLLHPEDLQPRPWD